MKLLLEIKDDKGAFILELLQNFKFVKTKTLTAEKAEALECLKDAIDEMNLIKKNKLKASPAKELLDEL